ncbi:hypothetical protein AB0K18_09115 [Nonomuraea sp. NPDC049421]|uniref:hypothetical protein n=1 Tax=Nonomuraea sp. NPDC049421 TaxID=3155275 RepID=UPI003413614D
MGERLEIHRETVEAGVKRWSGAAATLQARLADARARIESLHAARPWGQDATGREFERAYLADDGPGTLLRAGADWADFAVSAGPGVLESVNTSASADAGLATPRTQRAS